MENVSFFVIIVTYKGKQWYDRCFSSLQESELPIKVVVVDNASEDGTIEYLHTNYPNIHTIESKENLGFGRANNIGIRYALEQGCDYVFLLNQDAWVKPNTFSELIRIHSEHPEYGLLSPMHLTKDEQHIENGVLHYVDDYRITDTKFVEDLYFQRLSEIYPTTYINAAAWLLPRKTLEIVGGFDPLFYHYEEDDDYLNRVIFHKLCVGICPQVTIVHDSVRLPNRVSDHQKKVRHHQDLLVKCTNLNQTMSLSRLIIHIFMKGGRKILCGKSNEAFSLWNDAIFLYNTRNRIRLSRNNNAMKGRTWL